MMKTDCVAFLLLLGVVAIAGQKVDPREAKCLICKATLVEMDKAISKVDPRKKAEVGNFRIDATGDSGAKKMVPLVKSEMYLTELMEEICESMDDYAKARFKKDGKFTILKFIEDGGMNPLVSEVDFVQDGDLNKSLKHYCLEVLEDYEVDILKIYMADEPVKDADYKVCTHAARYCEDPAPQEEYTMEEDEESEREEL
ncbi:protein seele [Phlebotomus argentipes]|uniref:protein seele n=1 Tax=Phlebotomus argentipes TaxID=94469 RepID=UPI00289373AF|nr:protein seele [Phlebotomus argentipes]